jgi:hypothetical protein
MSINEITNFLNIKNFNFAEGGVFHEEGQVDIFFNILKNINTEEPKMFELGSYESFYSVVFNKFFQNKNVTNVCLEICKPCLDIGVQNSTNNECKNMSFEYASVGETNLGIYNGTTQFKDLEISDKKLTVKYLFDFYKIDVLDVLHVDVQGSEGSVLEEIQKEKLKINYFFINIHDDSITNNFYGYSVYEKCKQILDTFDVDYIYDNRIYGGYGDGLIVAKTKKI